LGSFATVRPNGKPGHVRYATEVGISGFAASYCGLMALPEL
jgi:hypothetical protein